MQTSGLSFPRQPLWPSSPQCPHVIVFCVQCLAICPGRWQFKHFEAPRKSFALSLDHFSFISLSRRSIIPFLVWAVVSATQCTSSLFLKFIWNISRKSPSAASLMQSFLLLISSYILSLERPLSRSYMIIVGCLAASLSTSNSCPLSVWDIFFFHFDY